MVSDSDRVSLSSPSRSRFARSTVASRIRTPRRPVRTLAELVHSSASQQDTSAMLSPAPPRRESAIPTPRRISRSANDQKESSIPSLRRVPRTPTAASKFNADKNDLKSPPNSSIRTPTARRTSIRAPVTRPNTTDSPAAESPRFPKSTSLSTPKTAYRRLSTANEESRSISRPTVPKSTVRRLSSANGQETSRRLKPTPRQDERAQLPDRGTNAIGCPSPAAQNRRTGGSGTPRLGLKASPYARRTSRGSSASAAAKASAAGTGGVSRKLNMGPNTEEEETTAQPQRKAFTVSPLQKKNGPSRLDIALRTGVVDRQQLSRPDRTEKRRDSGSGKGRVGVSALESFRAARRASLEAAEQAAAEQAVVEQAAVEQTVEEQAAADIENIPNADNIPVEKLTTTKPLQKIQPKPDTGHLPDRPDPIAPSAKLMPHKSPANPLRRASHRFSDAEVNLDNVTRLRHSLGRRRSHGLNSQEAPKTPVLRRTSLGKPENFDEPQEENIDSIGFQSTPLGELKSIPERGLRQRSPLRKLESYQSSNSGSTVSPDTQRKHESGLVTPPSSLPVPKLDDDELSWDHEEVEDLGAW